jgi:hypothetical protein
MRKVIVTLMALAALLGLLALTMLPQGFAEARPRDPGDPGGDPGIPPVEPCVQNITGTLSASPSSIVLGQSVTLYYAVTFPRNCNALGNITVAGQGVGTQGSLIVKPLVTQSYQLAFSGKTKTLALATVTVELPKVVRIKGNTLEWKLLLKEALLKPDTTVLLAHDVDMDLTGHDNILLAPGVTLTSEAPPIGLKPVITRSTLAVAPLDIRPARDAQNPGPRLFTHSRPKPLFNMRCDNEELPFGDNVSINGFRIHGPHFGSEKGDDNLERAIMIHSCHGIEISNMEIAGWSGAAIYIQGSPRDHRNQVKIHDNFIHHNQHIGGNGYGIDVAVDGHALIERNVFDFNRHAITASGEPGTGYRAHQNLVLRGGGYHGTFSNRYTQQFDVHGDRNCPDTPLTRSIWNCGNAGEYFEFTHNAFQYLNDNAIKVRGNPTVGALVADNVFAHGSSGDAIAQVNGIGPGDNITNPINIQGNNKYGVDTFGKYGVCDFDGDGVDDLFLATGQTWWYSSFGEFQWTYLSDRTERLNDVRLGYFDDDQRCDVMRENDWAWGIASGGTEPWKGMGTFGARLSEVAFGRFNPGIRDHRPGVTRRTTHAFRRTESGQWQVTPLSAPAWQDVQSSSFPMSKLRFGDFTGDGVTDVLAVQGGRWSISQSATGSWQRLNQYLADDVSSLLIADLNNNNIDDLIRLESTDSTNTWWVSDDGRSRWRKLRTYRWPDIISVPPRFAYAGRFGAAPGGGVLLIDEYYRIGQFYSEAEIAVGASPNWSSLFAY